LAAHHTVYGLDLVGWGGSRKPDIKYNIDLWVDQVYDFWQTFVGQPMILIGNSIGSLVALVAAARHPEMAASLVMVSLPDLSAEQEMIPKSIQPLVNGLKKVILNPPLLHTLFKIVSRPKVARKWAQIAYANPDRVTDDLIDLFLTPAQEREAPTAFVKIMQGMTSSNFSPNIRKLLPEMQIPIPLLELINLEAAGHCAHDEVPDVVNNTIRTWLDRLDPIQDPPGVGLEEKSDPNAQILDLPNPLTPMIYALTNGNLVDADISSTRNATS
jgi:pimeloyl-ACP methyl ester carboxylesterase